MVSELSSRIKKNRDKRTLSNYKIKKNAKNAMSMNAFEFSNVECKSSNLVIDVNAISMHSDQLASSINNPRGSSKHCLQPIVVGSGIVKIGT